MAVKNSNKTFEKLNIIFSHSVYLFLHKHACSAKRLSKTAI